MKAMDFLQSIGFRVGDTETVGSAFWQMFARSLDKLSLTDGQKLAVIVSAFLKMKQERDIALAALRREMQVNEGLRQQEFVFRQERRPSETPQPL